MGNIVESVENRIQSAILTAFDNIVVPKSELAVRSINASCGRNAASVAANSERGEHIGITASFENVSDRNNTYELNGSDATRGNISEELILTDNHTFITPAVLFQIYSSIVFCTHTRR